MQQTKQKRLWIDTDITLGEKNTPISYCDVDDAYALTACLRSTEVEVIGVSSTLGNSDDIAITTRIAKDFIQRFGPNSVEVYQGAASTYQLARQQPMPEALGAMAKALEEDELTILCIGAATNIALLVEHYPQLLRNIKEIVLLAGRRSVDQHFIAGHWQPKPFRDLNFEVDVAAFERLLDTAIPLTLVPYEACTSTLIAQKQLNEMLKGSEVSRFIADKSESWLHEWEIMFGAGHFIPFDMVAAAYCINPEWFSCHQWQCRIEQADSDTQAHQQKDYLVCNADIRDGWRVRYCSAAKQPLQDPLLQRICAHDMQHFVLGMSHINIIVDDIASATAFYGKALGFQLAHDQDGQTMDYQGVTMSSFALDAGIDDGKVNVDVRFLHHPQAGLYLELMCYHYPHGRSELPAQPRTYDLGGPRHIAMEVSNCNEVFNYLKGIEGVKMISSRDNYHPGKLDGFPISFFYWIDPYGVQWEMEEGRQVGSSVRGII